MQLTRMFQECSSRSSRKPSLLSIIRTSSQVRHCYSINNANSSRIVDTCNTAVQRCCGTYIHRKKLKAKPFHLDDEAFRRREQPDAAQQPRHKARLFLGKPRAVDPIPRSRSVLQGQLDIQGGSFLEPSAGEYLA